MKDAYPEPPLVAYRRDANLEDILVHKKHNKMFFWKPNSSGPCGAHRCAICPYRIEADSFEDADSNKCTMRNSVDCKSSNVVHAVFCEWCRAYVCRVDRRHALPATLAELVADLHTAR